MPAVAGEKGVGGFVIQTVFHDESRQIEKAVVHAGEFPVDHGELIAVVHEVFRKGIVMAGHFGEGRGNQRFFRQMKLLTQAFFVGKIADEAAVVENMAVGADLIRRRKTARLFQAAFMICFHQHGRFGQQDAIPLKIFGMHRRGVNEFGELGAGFGIVVIDLRRDAQCTHQGQIVFLRGAVDVFLGALAGDTGGDGKAVLQYDLVIVVGEPAGHGFDIADLLILSDLHQSGKAGQLTDNILFLTHDNLITIPSFCYFITILT